jgi:predicted Ser/Thr protein kinase
METKPVCPSCRKPLPPDVPMGLCPECLIKSGFNTGTDPGNPGKESGFVPPPVEELRKLFPQLEILELIGKGGMGAVYKARQPALDRLVALKILPPGVADGPGFPERFNREARALARLNHPHIVAVHDFGQAGGQPYLVMEFVDGLNLRQVEQARPLTPEQALQIVPQICDALQFAHNEGIVHRDIKPENILLDKKGRVKITDFGIAKILQPLTRPAETLSPSDDERAGVRGAALTGAKDVLGTPHYMAPEQVEKPSTVDHRADIYSLGVVFYELLTGELPLGKFQPPSKKVHVDVRLDEVVLHALEKEPERRYQQASQVKTDVETIAKTSMPRGGGHGFARSEAAKSRAEPSPLFSRTAIIGAAWAPWFFIAAVLFFTATTVDTVPGSLPPGPAWWQVLLGFTVLPLGLTAPFGTTILGGIAISQIRQSRGRLYGLGLAVFDVLLFPLLVLDAFMVVACLMGLRLHAASTIASGSMAAPPMWVSYWWLGLAIAGIIILVDWLIIRAVWRAAKIPVGGSPTSAPPTMASPSRSGGGGWKLAAVILLILAIPLGALLLAGLMKTQNRDRIVQGAVVAEVPITPPRADRFSPMQEVILNDLDEARGNEALSFESGQLLSLPADFGERTAAARAAWLDSNRVDLLVDYARDRWALLSRGVVFRDLHIRAWDAPHVGFGGQWPDTEVLERREAREGTLYLLPANAQPPLTFAFLTANGEQGVLQITGLFTNDPRGMKLRYKLAQPTGGGGGGGTGADFVATYRVERSQQALDAARDFVEEHQWRMQSESGDSERVVLKATDIAGRSITFENAVLGNGRAQLTIRAEPGAELSAGRIGAAIWRRLGWAMPEGASAESPEAGGPVARAKLITRSGSDEDDSRLRFRALETTADVFGSVTERTLYSVGTQRPITGEDLDNNRQVELPAGIENGSEDEFFHWLAANGVDLMAFAHKRSWALWASPKLASASSELWERAQLADLHAALRSGEPGLMPMEPDVKEGFAVYGLSTNTPMPLTLAFETRAGRVGLLQIMGFTESPQGVSIRYKLAPSESKVTGDQVAVEDLASRMVAAIRDKQDAALKAMAVDLISGWRDALPIFAQEMRERYRHMLGNERFDLRPAESLVVGDRAVVKCDGPNELRGTYLVLFFVKTTDGWRN